MGRVITAIILAITATILAFLLQAWVRVADKDLVSKDGWMLYDTSMDDTQFFVNNDKIIRRGEIAVLAIKEVLSDEQPLTPHSDIRYKYKREVVTVNCRTNYVESIDFIKYYNSKDELVFGPESSEGYKLEPTYIMTDLANKACKEGGFKKHG